MGGLFLMSSEFSARNAGGGAGLCTVEKTERRVKRLPPALPRLTDGFPVEKGG